MIFNNLIAVSAKKFLFEMFVFSSTIFHDYVLSPMLFLEYFANNDLYILFLRDLPVLQLSGNAFDKAVSEISCDRSYSNTFRSST